MSEDDEILSGVFKRFLFEKIKYLVPFDISSDSSLRFRLRCSYKKESGEEWNKEVNYTFSDIELLHLISVRKRAIEKMLKYCAEQLNKISFLEKKNDILFQHFTRDYYDKYSLFFEI